MIDFKKVYRRLLRFYPASFREEYEAPMYRQFCDEQREAEGWSGHAKLWFHAISDVAISAPSELLRELGQDLHFALRIYFKRPLCAWIAVGTLALATGAGTGVFSVASALLLRSLPFADAARLVELRRSPFTAGMGHSGFREWRAHSSYLIDAATFSIAEMNLNSGRDALRVRVAETSANFFSVLGVKSHVGRTFAADEDKTGQNHVAVISHRIWQQAYGEDPSVVGTTTHLDGAPLIIIGVAPPRFDYPGNVDIWTPTVFDLETIPKHGAFLLQTIGRLKPGITIALARQRFEADASHAGPERFRPDDRNDPSGPQLVGLRDQLSSQIRQSVLVLALVVLLVLLTGCANVAQLLLSRTAERHQELALRSALGASRTRLVQQLTVEATVLSFAGSAGGILVAMFVSRMAGSTLPAQLATQNYTLLDWRVLCFAVALALIAGGVLGIVPAWLIGRIQPSTQFVSMNTATRTTEPVTRRLRAALVSLQVAFTFTLLVSSITLCNAFLRLVHTDLGFQPANVVTLNVSLQGTNYQSGNAKWQYYSALGQRLLSIPGVEAVGAVNYLPLASKVLMASAIQTQSGVNIPGVVLNGVMPGYFKAMGTKFLAGREFENGARKLPEPLVIVNEEFARQAGLGSNIVGTRIIAPWTKQPYLVSGLVATARMGGPQYDGEPQAYWAVQEEPPAALTFVASVHGDAGKYLTKCRDVIIGLDRSVPVYEVKTLGQRLTETLERPRFYTTSVLFLGCLTLLVAVAGVYSTSSRAITQRQHELGVRMALGASMQSVRALMLRQSLPPIVIGILAGIAGAAECGFVFQHLFVGARAPSGTALIVASLFMFVIACSTAWSATTRILAINPIESIRAE
jgi:predicted permease